MKKFIKSLVTLFIIITVWSCLYKIGLFGKDTIFCTDTYTFNQIRLCT